MRSFTPPDLERRSGTDRRHDAAVLAGPGRRHARRAQLAAPFKLGPSLVSVRPRDPWAAVVGRALADYADGRAEDLVRSWDDRLVWRVVAARPPVGPSPARRAYALPPEGRDATRGTLPQGGNSIEGSGRPTARA